MLLVPAPLGDVDAPLLVVLVVEPAPPEVVVALVPVSGVMPLLEQPPSDVVVSHSALANKPKDVKRRTVAIRFVIVLAPKKDRRRQRPVDAPAVDFLTQTETPGVRMSARESPRALMSEIEISVNDFERSRHAVSRMLGVARFWLNRSTKPGGGLRHLPAGQAQREWIIAFTGQTRVAADARSPQSARRKMSPSSSAVSVSGLPFMLLAAAALATRSSTCSLLMP